MTSCHSVDVNNNPIVVVSIPPAGGRGGYVAVPFAAGGSHHRRVHSADSLHLDQAGDVELSRKVSSGGRAEPVKMTTHREQGCDAFPQRAHVSD